MMKFSVTLMLLAVASLTNSTNYSRFKSVRASAPRDACTCGVANPSRVIGGAPVWPPHKYPWVVGIKFEQDSSYWCGGSIINDRYILTAAHCFFNNDGSQISTFGLVVGVADYIMNSTIDDIVGATRLVKVDVIIHPRYNQDYLTNDIALLKMWENLDLSKHKEIRPVCLPTDASKSYAGYMGTVCGWGHFNSTAQPSPVLMEALVPILHPSCWYGVVGPYTITPDMLCAIDVPGGRDACAGDSGGPLTVEEGDRYTQVGVVSFGLPCGTPSLPGVYTRVTSFLHWIKANTADAIYC